MAKGEAIQHCYNCGKKIVIRIDRHKRREVNAAIEYFESLSSLCPDCYYNNLAEQDISDGYADLVGSPKQIKWAYKLRREMISRIKQYCNQYADDYRSKGDDASAAQCDDVLCKTIDVYKGVTSAAWWIDNRSVKAWEYVRAATDPQFWTTDAYGETTITNWGG